MKSICQKITKHKCSWHDEAYGFLCIEEVCTHGQRLMCGQCIDLKNTVGLINIRQAFEFFGTQQIKQDTEIYECQAYLWQQFTRTKFMIQDSLNRLELYMNKFIESISGNETISKLKSDFQDREMNNNLIQKLALLLNGKIVMDNGQYRFTEQISLQQQISYIKSNEILTVLQQAMTILSCKLYSLLGIPNRTPRIDLDQSTIVDDSIPYDEYQTIQKIDLDNVCRSLCFNHNETQIAAAVDNQIIIFVQQGKKWIHNGEVLIGHIELIWQVKFNHNSTQLVSCSKDKLIIIWNNKWQGKWQIQENLSEHTDEVNSICYNHDSTLFASGSDDKSIQIYCLNKGNWLLKQKLTDHSGWVYDVCFNHDSSLLASGSRDQSIILWKLNSLGKWVEMLKLLGHNNSVFRVAFNSKSTSLLSGSDDYSIKLWKVDKSKLNRWKRKHLLVGHTDQIRSVYFNSESDMILSSSEDYSIKIWRMNQDNIWECRQTIKHHSNHVGCAIFSRDSSIIISGSNDNTIMIHKR